MSITASNLIENLPADLSRETTEILHETASARVERIVSHGHASPADFWYDQEQDEFVVLIAGEARLRFADPESSLTLRPGDCLTIPAHCRHRVEWTTPHAPTVWLAVFL